MTRTTLSVAALALAGAVGVAQAQFSTGFEAPTYSGSAAGTVLTGQQGWYSPVAGSSDYNVYTYANNALNIPTNPFGQEQFVANRSEPSPALGRAQKDVNFSSGGLWEASWDVYTRFDGTTPATQFPGSWSLQDSTQHRYFQQLMSWDDPTTADSFTINYLTWQSDGTPTPGGIVLAGAVPPGPEWESLRPDNWYRERVVWDFDTNRIVSMHLTDLTTGITADAFPTDRYLFGGDSPTRPLPTGIRLFTGGGAGDNVTAWDNLTVIPSPGALALLALGGLAAARRRR